MSNPLLEGSLRALNLFAGSELAERVGLREPAQRWIAKGTQLGAEWLQKQLRAARDEASADADPRDRFDLSPTESQALVQQAMRRFADEILREAAAEAEDAGKPPDSVLRHASELGLVQLAIPEAFGGAAEERSPITSALALEELARGDMALALALAAPASAAHLLVDFGTEAQKKAWLPRLAEDTLAAPALLEARPLFDPRAPEAKAKSLRRGFRLKGRKAFVPLGRRAAFFLVSATLPGRGPRLFLVEADRPGVIVYPEPAMGLRGADLCSLRLDVEVPDDALIGGDDFDHQRLVDLGRVGWGALAVGQGQATLEYVKTYCNDRVAFGEPITNRQSVAFLIADMAIELEGMRLMVWRAAARAERGLDFTGQAHLAKLQCARYGMKIGTDGVQLLGGAGFVREHPVERWYRHLRAVGVMEGGVAA
ncbi:MAG: acyl-CoA dehydrogenase [Sandaracinaceae bacterium]|nr:MAG: acyl-CoA dehydrogenase [Sandaracinaceae bacterium]